MAYASVESSAICIAPVTAALPYDAREGASRGTNVLQSSNTCSNEEEVTATADDPRAQTEQEAAPMADDP